MDKIYVIDESKSKVINGTTYYLTTGIPERNTTSGEPNYTNAEYAIAYANGQIIAAEIIKAYNEGYRHVRLKTGEYSLCASSTSGTTKYVRPAIFLQGIHGMDIDFGNSKFRVINDSVFLHPYHNHSYNPIYTAYTVLLSTYNCTDIHLHSAQMIGDVADRSWVEIDANHKERNFEQSNAIEIEDRCVNIEISNIEFSMWMDNAITNGSLFHNGFVRRRVGGWLRGKTIDSEGQVVDQAEGARPYYVSGMIEFDTPYQDIYPSTTERTMREYNSVSCIKGFEDYLCFRAAPTTTNFLYMPYMDYPGFSVYYYRRNDQNELVYSGSSMLSNNFGYINIGAYDAMRVLIANEETDLSEVENLATYFQLMVQAVPNFGLKIHDCVIRDTHKGGVSNLPSFSEVYNNTFVNCSKDCGIGAPLWDYDGTLYCIDLEDIFSTNVVIRNNRFDNSKIAMMLGCDETEVYGNLIIGCSTGISIRFGSNFNIHDNKITGTSSVFNVFNNAGTWRGGDKHITNISVRGNYFEGTTFSSDSDERRYINYRDNLFIVKNINVRGGRTDNIFTNCKFILKPGTDTLILRNSTFENCILESESARKLEPLNIKGSLYMTNIEYRMLDPISSSENVNVIDGMHFGSGCSLYINYTGANYSNKLIIKNCVFDGRVTVMRYGAGVIKTYVTDSVFLGSNACEAEVSGYSYTGMLEFTAYNCKFHCAYEDIFKKYDTPNRNITYKLANCLFEYPK